MIGADSRDHHTEPRHGEPRDHLLELLQRLDLDVHNFSIGVAVATEWQEVVVGGEGDREFGGNFGELGMSRPSDVGPRADIGAVLLHTSTF